MLNYLGKDMFLIEIWLRILFKYVNFYFVFMYMFVYLLDKNKNLFL